MYEVNKNLLKELKQLKKDAVKFRKIAGISKAEIKRINLGIKHVKKGRPRMSGFELKMISNLKHFK